MRGSPFEQVAQLCAAAVSRASPNRRGCAPDPRRRSPGSLVRFKALFLCGSLHQAAEVPRHPTPRMTVPVVDLFAGPGGLGEGFSRARAAAFQIAISIEKDGMAFETLQLRAAHRALAALPGVTRSSWARWDLILAESPWNVAFEMLRSSADPLIKAACEVARREAIHLELGPDNRVIASEAIRARLRPFMARGRLPDNTVIIGGPPCQAYSIVGRSRNRGNKNYEAASDDRHFLYREYLHVFREFRPAAFVMENVKGILTSRVEGRQIFQSIVDDLRRPDLACGQDVKLEYELVALTPSSSGGLFDLEPTDFIVQAEAHGVPQARHRVIICGIRKDVAKRAKHELRLTREAPPTVGQVMDDLPPLRSEVSFRGRGMTWIECLDAPLMTDTLRALRASENPDLARVAKRMESGRDRARRQSDPGIGADRHLVGAGAVPLPAALARWYRDRSLSLLANHEARAHMPSDLIRYLFVAAFGQETGESPRLADFPLCLLPDHNNVDVLAPEDAIFKDRFRVQIRDRHSMTVTSHIAKDGHAFVHHDTVQCRSITVREAARLQTFPDSYVFLGNRTSQYSQVGNAVPPYLAVQIAECIGKVLENAGMS
jgi:DNA (cytosine-5)-methyltransferase 1